MKVLFFTETTIYNFNFEMMNYNNIIFRMKNSTRSLLDSKLTTTVLSSEANSHTSLRNSNTENHKRTLTENEEVSIKKQNTDYLNGEKKYRKIVLQHSNRNSDVTQVSTKSKLKNLTYCEKIQFIQIILKKLSEQVEDYGFFYVTEPMIQYNKVKPLVGEVTFYSQQGVYKPTHPIHRTIKILEEHEFIQSLKRLLRKLFPTIDFGTRRTILGLIYYLNDLSNIVVAEKRSSHSRSQRSSISQCKSITSFRRDSSQNDFSTFQLKEIGRTYTDENYLTASLNKFTQKRLRVNQYHSSTSDIETKKSLCDFKIEEESITESPSIQNDHIMTDDFLFQEENQNKFYQPIQSLSGQQNVRTSIVIQNELDDLFKSSLDIRKSSFYDNSKLKKMQSISKVFEDFQNLF